MKKQEVCLYDLAKVIAEIAKTKDFSNGITLGNSPAITKDELVKILGTTAIDKDFSGQMVLLDGRMFASYRTQNPYTRQWSGLSKKAYATYIGDRLDKSTVVMIIDNTKGHIETQYMRLDNGLFSLINTLDISKVSPVTWTEADYEQAAKQLNLVVDEVFIRAFNQADATVQLNNWERPAVNVTLKAIDYFNQ